MTLARPSWHSSRARLKHHSGTGRAPVVDGHAVAGILSDERTINGIESSIVGVSTARSVGPPALDDPHLPGLRHTHFARLAQ
jgi:hypothetical protein